MESGLRRVTLLATTSSNPSCACFFWASATSGGVSGGSLQPTINLPRWEDTWTLIQGKQRQRVARNSRESPCVDSETLERSRGEGPSMCIRKYHGKLRLAIGTGCQMWNLGSEAMGQLSIFGYGPWSPSQVASLACWYSAYWFSMVGRKLPVNFPRFRKRGQICITVFTHENATHGAENTGSLITKLLSWDSHVMGQAGRYILKPGRTSVPKVPGPGGGTPKTSGMHWTASSSLYNGAKFKEGLICLGRGVLIWDRAIRR